MCQTLKEVISLISVNWIFSVPKVDGYIDFFFVDEETEAYLES